MVDAARKEHRGAVAPACAERGRADREAPRPGARLLGAIGGAAIGPGEPDHERGQHDHQGLPGQHHLRGLGTPEEGAEDHAHRKGAAGRGDEAAVGEVAALAQKLERGCPARHAGKILGRLLQHTLS